MSTPELTREQSQLITRLYRDSRDKLVGWLISRGLDATAAIDLYQQSIMVVSERLMKHGEGHFANGMAAYLFSVMKYMYFDAVKKQGKTTTLSEGVETLEQMQDEIIDFLQEPDEETLLLKKNLEQLDQKSYKLLRLFYFDGKSMREIAEIMDYSSEQVAKSTKYRILVKLRKLMT